MLVVLGLIQNGVVVCGIGDNKFKLNAVKACLVGNFTGNSVGVSAPWIEDDEGFAFAGCFVCACICRFSGCDSSFHTIVGVADKSKTYIVSGVMLTAHWANYIVEIYSNI